MSRPHLRHSSGKIALAGLLCAFLSGPAAFSQRLIEPPFGLRWGDSPEKLISWSSKHSLDLNILTPGKQPALRVLTIKAPSGFLPDSPASAVEGQFLNGGLFEMTVHYADPDATAEQMELRFEQMRKRLGLEYGGFLANQQRRIAEDQFVTRTQSFHKEPVRGVFLLVAWTEVEDLLRKTRQATFSLVYRNDNFKKELGEKTPLLPE